MSDFKELTEQQRVFCREYVKDFNGTRAALAAKYSVSGAAVQSSRLLKNDNVKLYIQELTEELSMSAAQIIKKQSDIALANLADYAKIVKKEVRKKVKIPLRKIIERAQSEIDRTERYISRAELTKEEIESFDESLLRMRNNIIKLEIELEDNPAAHRIELSDSYLEDDIQLDLVKLVKDKEKGIIHSLKWDEFGRPEVGLYPAATALDKLARIRDLYIEKSEQKVALTHVEKEEIQDVFTVKIIAPEEE